ncbi:DNA repair protein, partial [Aspergillus sclerotialis]
LLSVFPRSGAKMQALTGTKRMTGMLQKHLYMRNIKPSSTGRRLLSGAEYQGMGTGILISMRRTWFHRAVFTSSDLMLRTPREFSPLIT